MKRNPPIATMPPVIAGAGTGWTSVPEASRLYRRSAVAAT